MTEQRSNFSSSTPMMKQYAEIKSSHPDTILFFRLGDFYEMFFEDAKIGADVLGITLTSRNKGKDGRVPMAGVPYHAADAYVAKLVQAGYKVAICEQVSDPNESGIVEREVVRIVTPGTLLDEKHLQPDMNNYVMAIAIEEGKVGVATSDLGTGDFRCTEVEDRPDSTPRASLIAIIADEIERFQPNEIILSPTSYDNTTLLKSLKQLNPVNIYPSKNWPQALEDAQLHLRGYFDVETLEGFGLKGKPVATLAAAALLLYLVETQKGRVRHLKHPQLYQAQEFLTLDASTVRNLELFRTMREGDRYGSLWSVLNHTRTAMGGRLLRSWMLLPLVNEKQINARYDVVTFFLNERELGSRCVEKLAEVRDVERILGRLSVGAGNARDLVALKESFGSVHEIADTLLGLSGHETPRLLNSIVEDLRLGEGVRVHSLIDRAIKDDPVAVLREGEMIKDGFHEKLDQLRVVMRGGKDWLLELEKRERDRTHIDNLKVGFNRVFGYYIEVTKSKIALVPEGYVRKQTLANSERYITQELKEHEEKVLQAEEQAKELEYKLFLQVVAEILNDLKPLQKVAQAVATLDVLVTFASLAERGSYVRPQIEPMGSNGGAIIIEAGRHPVIERLQAERQFVPNDTLLDSGKNQVLILTGANMAGKSTYIRQVALLVLMAQMGSFVPAKRAHISTVDRIFTRLGASDQLAAGFSTFMVEMVETANILNNLTDRSLVVLDEVGRGTSTYDGISIAWAVAEHLALNTKTKVLFATHYHELTELGEQLANLQNYHLAVADDPESNQIIFLYRVRKGKADRSYGIHVAQRAGLPKDVIIRASQILSALEEIRTQHRQRKKLKELPLFGET